MVKLLILDGCDRTGKDTISSALVRSFDNTTIRHFKEGSGSSDREKHASQYIACEREFTLATKRQLFYSDFKELWVWNRSHLSEYVYSTLYRDIQRPQWIFDMEARYGFNTDPTVYAVMLYADPAFLCKHDDGLSHTKELPVKSDEISLFKEAFARSGIQNKTSIKVDDIGKYRPVADIVDEIKNFIR